jgi:uncharacterized protein (TIGR02217 family)
MEFHDVRFPAALEQTAQGGPSYNTNVVTTLAGYEQRNANWSMPRYSWTATVPYGDQATFDELLAFFHARAGQLYGFRFSDPADNTAVDQPVWHDTVAGVWRLAKAYPSGPVTLLRKITRPVLTTVTLSHGGTVDYSTGIVTGGATDGSNTWSGQFDVPVRFAKDAFTLTMQQVDVGIASVDLIEIRE